MRIPKSSEKLLEFVIDKVRECTYSQATRARDAANNLAYYENGGLGNRPSLYNRTGVHIDRLSSYLYAPGEVRYSIGFDATDGEPWLTRAKLASKYLSREYRRADGDVVFAQGVETALIKNCSLLKHNWDSDDALSPGFNPMLVHPEFFGVEREDMQRLEDQQAFVHTYYLSKNQIYDLIEGRDDKAELRKAIKKLGGGDVETKQNWLHQVVLGGLTPVAQNSPSGATGQASISPSSMTQFSPDMMQDLLRVDELWVVNSEQRDYNTIQLLEGLYLLEGKYRLRNLTGIKGFQPFSKICPDPVSGYFWGRSEVARVIPLQDMLSQRMRDVQRLLKLQVRAPKALIGFTGVNAQKFRAATAPGGMLQSDNPNASIKDMAPTLPQEVFREIAVIESMFDEVGGFKPILQGEGEPGVRSNSHAKQLMRTASPKLRSRALVVERDVETSAGLTFELLQAKDARVFEGEETKESFYLKQMPEDHYVEVDSHSSSPVFTEDAQNLAFGMKKLNIIDGDDALLLIHPPLMELLLSNSKKRAAARQKFLADHPDIANKAAKKGG
jgi:hypothetical protein